MHYDVGGELQYDFILASSTRVYAGVGFGFYYSGTSDKNDLDGPGRVGLGVGGEFRLTESFHCCVEGLFTYFTDGTILPLPQVGVFYYFL